MFIIQYKIMPEGNMGRADLPLAVETWLTPVQLCLNRIQEEASDK